MKGKLREFLIITLGVLLIAISLEYFFIPNKIAAGGLTGLAIVINHYIPFISTGPLVLIMDLILYAVGFMFLGRNFGVKTIYASLSLSLIMSFIETFLNPQAITNDLIIATIFGTIITALGMSLVFHMDAGTGGTDTIAKILNKFFHIDIGKSLLMVDFIVTSLGAITFGINIGLYALLAVIINGIAIDNVIAGFHMCKEVTIISRENEKIGQYIMNELDRGCTFLKGVGGFSGKDTAVLYTVLERKEFIKLKQYISEIDKKAFITVGEVHEVMGEGFKEI
ncbi:YitT family protein [Clostridium chauvoei]|uniref:YitT family protein n=2 Tax=Clostridium chauvoei TaxID=46867 RepID=A0ABD4RIW1_9CLOT|nr:YitT family protein [Clostridium chauvoei]ATD54065.1 hypothetical protein BTM20_01955 [Clostridium chauvoei]ATD58484.1 hypothetical protein BTM21_12495 [Clostridium chauvoei]MBX7281304.1 YitT family protein [Clostridium chauvoei]MBX7283790.1 YitT family protein [Clostridium chauvoei]MBX7286393.1 YitT family protein [Clostridium chauvoei]